MRCCTPQVESIKECAALLARMQSALASGHRLHIDAPGFFDVEHTQSALLAIEEVRLHPKP